MDRATNEGCFVCMFTIQLLIDFFMKKYVFIMTMLYVAASNATQCSVSQVEWEYKLTEGSGKILSQGTRKWEWSEGDRVLDFGYPFQGKAVYRATTDGIVQGDSLPNFTVDTMLRLYNRDANIGRYEPGKTTGYWGGFWGTDTTSLGVTLKFTMSDNDPEVTAVGDCGDWIPGISMTSTSFSSFAQNSNKIHLVYNSVFRFKTAPLTSKINIALTPSVINMMCTIGKDCITESNLIITNPGSWSGKMFVTYPAVEGVNYDYLGNWLGQVVEVHEIRANTNPKITKKIQLSSKKPGNHIFNVPIQVELV